MSYYKFQNFTLDLQKQQLFKNEERLDIEPQVLRALQLLIEKCHKVVSKEELLEKVWQQKSVSDSAISHTIYQLRKTLGDSSQQQSIIKTLHGKGYQFIAPVKHKEHLPDIVPTFLFQPNRLVIIIIFFIITGLSAYAWQFNWFGQSGSLSHKNEVGSSNFNRNSPQKTVVAILPFKIINSSPELSILASAVSDYLHQQLTEFNIVPIYAKQSSTAQQADDIWAIQRKTHANYLIELTVTDKAQQTVMLDLTLYKFSHDGQILPFSLGRFDLPYPNSKEELNELYSQRRNIVKEVFNLIRPGMNISPQSLAETKDPEAYRLVIAAYHLQRTDICHDFYRAEELLQQALQRDPDFAYAWRTLFGNYYKRVWICGESVNYYEKALLAAARAEQLAPGKYNAVIIGRNGILVETNRVEEAYKLSQHASFDDPDALYRTAYALRYSGFLNEASKRITRILQLDPYYFSGRPIAHSPNTLLYLNRLNEYLNLLSYSENNYHGYYRSLVFVLQNKEEKALSTLNKIIKAAPEDLFGKFSHALKAIVEQNYSKANRVIESIETQRIRQKQMDGEITYKQAQLYALADNPAKALHNLDKAIEQGFFCVNCFLQDPTLKELKKTVKFSNLIKKAKLRHLKFSQQFNLEPEN